MGIGDNTINLLSRLKEFAEEKKVDLSFDVYWEDESFNVNEVEVYFKKYLKDFKYLDYMEFQHFADILADNYDNGITINIIFDNDNNYDDDYYQPDVVTVEASNTNFTGAASCKNYTLIVEDFPISEEKKILYKRSINSLSYMVNIDKDGIVEIIGDGIDKDEDLCSIDGFNEYVNRLIKFSDLTDLKKVEIIEKKSSKELFKLLKEDLINLSETNYFDDFLENVPLIKDSVISIYFQNKPRIRRSLINIFHQGYGFNWNAYDYDNPIRENLNFQTLHTFEDLSWLNSTVSDYYSKSSDSHNLNGRGEREVSVGKSLDLLPILVDYLSSDIINMLNEYSEFEVVLNKGPIDKIILSDMRMSGRVLGINKNNDKVLSMYIDWNGSLSSDINVEQLKNGINKLILDLNK